MGQEMIIGFSEQIVTIDTYIRIAIFIVSIAGGIMGLGLWYNRKINHLSVSKYWRLFIVGIIFYSIGAFSDIFTPRFFSSMATHNVLTETIYLIGLGLIFISLHRFIDDYVKTKKEATDNKLE